MIEKFFTGIFSAIATIFVVMVLGVGSLFNWLYDTFRITKEYGFYNTEEDIIEISIVTVYYDENGKAALNEIRKVDDIEQFIEDYRAVECYGKISEPVDALDRVDKSTKLIKLTYVNGDFELIGYHGSGLTNVGEDELEYTAGFTEFNKDQLDELMERYSVSG